MELAGGMNVGVPVCPSGPAATCVNFRAPKTPASVNGLVPITFSIFILAVKRV